MTMKLRGFKAICLSGYMTMWQIGFKGIVALSPVLLINLANSAPQPKDIPL